MKEKTVNKVGVFALVFLFAFFMQRFSIASGVHDIPLCGGAIVPNDLPNRAIEASTAGEPVALKQASQDKVHVIDIAFIYPGSITNKGKLLQNVEAVVLKANVIFERSSVNARLRTVAVRPDHQYNISLDRTSMNDAADKMRSILSKVRANYGADLVYALTNNERPKACGIAGFRGKGADKMLASQYLAVGVIWNGIDNDGCLGDTYILAHEVGHNLGLTHNIENTSNTPFVSYGRGYSGKNINNKSYSTVMGTRGSGFDRFSTEAVHDGLKMGSGQANAAKALLYTIEDASNYAPTKVRDPRQKYSCTESATNVCLQSGRFKVEGRVSYRDHKTGEYVNNQKAKVKKAQLNGTTKTSSLFYFFNETNPELLIKVVNACGVNGKYWVFGSAATDLDYSVIVTDNATGVTLPYYRNARDPLINDTGAFPCHP